MRWPWLAIVFEPEIRERFATTVAELFILVEVDDLRTLGQMRVVSSLGCGSPRLLPTFLFGRNWLQRIDQIVGTIG
jgi:hypothetical protein